jgi:hypothetical protein
MAFENSSQNLDQKVIDEILPEEYEQCMFGLNAITKEAWNIV